MCSKKVLKKLKYRLFENKNVTKKKKKKFTTSPNSQSHTKLI